MQSFDHKVLPRRVIAGIILIDIVRMHASSVFAFHSLPEERWQQAEARHLAHHTLLPNGLLLNWTHRLHFQLQHLHSTFTIKLEFISLCPRIYVHCGVMVGILKLGSFSQFVTIVRASGSGGQKKIRSCRGSTASPLTCPGHRERFFLPSPCGNSKRLPPRQEVGGSHGW